MDAGITQIADDSDLLAPGVYFEEVVPRRDAAFRTGVPVFVGFVDEGAPGPKCRNLRIVSASRGCRAVLLTAWREFSHCVGRAVADGYLDYAVRGFFENGGSRCVVVSVPASGDRVTQLKWLFNESSLLDDLEEVDLVCVPDLMREEIRHSPDLLLGLQLDVLDHCRRMGNRFAILDSGLIDRPDSDAFRHTGLEYDRQQTPVTDSAVLREGAVYQPWIRVRPLPRHHREAPWVPASGHVAGVYARTDAATGVHKAPANEVAEGALDLKFELTDAEQARLNEIGINCLRSFPGRGIRVWGARTLTPLPNWKYVNVRRLFVTLVRWCGESFDDLVFENYLPALWDRVRERVESYCLRLLQQGALKGRNPGEAFFVKCDAELNPPESRAAGQVICEIGLAPVVPAEFVIVRITQSAAGITAVMPGTT